MKSSLLTLTLAVAIAGGAACADPAETGSGPVRTGDDLDDGRGRDDTEAGDDGDATNTDDTGGDDRDASDDIADSAELAEDDGSMLEEPGEEVEAPDVSAECDLDEDGFEAESCGGDDCDDADGRRNPGQAELCDFDDNDCDGDLNNGIECLVYAHTSTQLFLVDPFRGELEPVTSVPGLYDLDTASDGTLYGISSSTLYTFNVAASRWFEVGGLDGNSGNANGFAIDSSGVGWATSSNDVYRVDLASGDSTRVGSMGGGFNSSGDCVINKDDTLYMTSGSGFSNDQFIRIDSATGRGSAIGDTGFSQVYGLTSAWGYMFGFTSDGDVIEIDTSTGAGTRVASFGSQSWFGAASSPGR